MISWWSKISKRIIRETTDSRPDTVGDTVDSLVEPLLLKGLVNEWPIVQAGQESPQDAADYLRQFYSGDRMTAFTGPPEIRGRVGYNDDLTGFSFERGSATLDEVLNPIFEHLDDENPPTCYVGSTLLDRWFPGFRDHNDLSLGDRKLLASIWIGNRIRVSAHFDVADNIACCVAGRRRFTLFPPDQLDNLYVGPWDVTPAGQAISLVDFENPDFEKYPKFREALESSYMVTLEPGDALFLPSMWWHHVEGLEGLNVLVNYWWRSTPAFMGSPLNVLKHALLGLHGLPPEQRSAWQHILDYYVFNPPVDGIAHLPESSRGILSPSDDLVARKLRADLLNQLNR
jgi:hypothetical protein